MSPTPIAYAALSLELGVFPAGGPPAKVLLLPAGRFNAADGSGRPLDAPGWLLTREIGERLVAAAKAKGPLLVDYEHTSLNAQGPTPAAGWIKGLEFNSAGLFGNVEWTDKARAMISEQEYKFISPCFSYEPGSGEVLGLISVALTNTPALSELPALMAAKTSWLARESDPRGWLKAIDHVRANGPIIIHKR